MIDAAKAHPTDPRAAPLLEPPSAVLCLLTAVAILFGLWGRFKGLGTWPLADDEYYVARAVQDILRVGMPEFDCGGWYVRGLPYQYLVALLQFAGLTPEFSLRIVAAVSSLIVLPAVYILGKRIHSSNAGLLAVIVLSISVWEIEMARFGRMYMPFQAIFTWYLVYFVRYVIDRSRSALWPMLGLSLLGGMTWEGGMFLMALNALPPFIGKTTGRLDARDWRYLVMVSLLAVPIFFLVFHDFRYSSEVPPYPDDFNHAAGSAQYGDATGESLPVAAISSHPIWLIAALVPAGAVLAGLGWAWRFRQRWLAATGLALTLLLALGHQFAAVASILLLMLLTGIVTVRELFSRTALPFHASIVLSLLAWLALGLGNDLWIPEDAQTWLGQGRAIAVAYELFGYPDFLLQVVRPWAGAQPVYGLILLALLCLAAIRVIRAPPRVSTMSVLVIVVAAMLVAVGMSDPPRQETRYVFFLYPVVVLIAVSTALALLRDLPKRWAFSSLTGSIAVMVGFMLLEDFQPRHVFAIDSAAVNFRIGLPGRLASHYHPRSDPRGAAQWIEQHATRPGDLVINGFPAASFYSARFDFAYTDIRHQRFRAYACRRGKVERWSNLPLLHDAEEIREQARSHDRVFLVLDREQFKTLRLELSGWKPNVGWVSDDGEVLAIILHNQYPS